MLRVNQLNGFGAGVFNPGDLNPQIWFDPSDASTVKQEITGASATTPSLVGDPVGSIRNKGTLGGWLTAASTLNRATLTALNNRFAMTLTSGCNYSMPVSLSGAPSNTWMASAYEVTSAASYPMVCGWVLSVDNIYIRHFAGTGRPEAAVDQSSNYRDVSGASSVVGVGGISILTNDSAALKFWRGVTYIGQSTISQSAVNYNDFQIGHRNTLFPYTGVIAEVVSGLSTLSDVSLVKLASYLSVKTGYAL